VGNGRSARVQKSPTAQSPARALTITEEGSNVDKIQTVNRRSPEQSDREIIVNGKGMFPKKLIFRDEKGDKQYWLIKTSSGKYLLNK
jgi:hypothetical protein